MPASAQKQRPSDVFASEFSLGLLHLFARLLSLWPLRHGRRVESNGMCQCARQLRPGVGFVGRLHGLLRHFTAYGACVPFMPLVALTALGSSCSYSSLSWFKAQGDAAPPVSLERERDTERQDAMLWVDNSIELGECYSYQAKGCEGLEDARAKTT